MTPPQSLVLLLSATAMVVATCLSQAHAQVFRTTADAVLIDVSVRQNGAFVRGLTRDDFILSDNGVRQEIVAVHDSMMPLQITTIVDASYSITDDVRNSFMRLAESLKSLATVDDIFDMVRLDGTVRRVRSATEVFTPSDAQARTGLLDGLAVVLLDPPQLGCRRLIVMLTDGADTSSLLTSNVVAAIAQRADTVLHIVAVKDPLCEQQGGLPPRCTAAAVPHDEVSLLRIRAADEHVGVREPCSLEARGHRFRGDGRAAAAERRIDLDQLPIDIARELLMRLKPLRCGARTCAVEESDRDERERREKNAGHQRRSVIDRPERVEGRRALRT